MIGGGLTGQGKVSHRRGKCAGAGSIHGPSCLDESAAKAQHGWELAKAKIVSGDYNVVILDEMTYCFSFGWLDFAEVRAWLDVNKPPMLHLIITGRDAIPELIEYADLVTEMREIKHPFTDQGILAQPGIEF